MPRIGRIFAENKNARNLQIIQRILQENNKNLAKQNQNSCNNFQKNKNNKVAMNQQRANKNFADELTTNQQETCANHVHKS